MRREEKEIQNQEEISRILEQAPVCRIALNDDPFPYLVPVNFVYAKQCLYFHSALEGRKMDLIERNGKLCFEVDRQIGLVSGDRACRWGMRYESVIGEGEAIVLADPDEKRAALLGLMEKYTSRSDWEIPPEALQDVALVRVDILHISGKRSGA